MLQVRNLVYSIAGRSILDGVDWSIGSQARYALVGANGAGKTTLLRVICGEIQPQKGSINRPRGYVIGYLPQEEVNIEDGSVLESALKGKKEAVILGEKIRDLHVQLENSGINRVQLLRELGECEERYQALKGYSLESETERVLSGLGFKEKEFYRPLSEMSGGWRMRAYLGRLLLQEPDLLLLDEPSNHLDLPSLEWLEKYLVQFSGSIIIVSHDRFFIDSITSEIYEIDKGSLNRYKGHYKFFLDQKREKERLHKKKWEEQQAEIRRQKEFIARNRVRKDRAAQVQSRMKFLEKMELIDPPEIQSEIDFELSVDVQSFKEVLALDHLGFSYGETQVLKGITASITRGDRAALIGVNGAGKTTLTRLITGKLQPQKGSLCLGGKTTVGLYVQHQLEMLNPNSSIYDEVLSTTPETRVPQVRNVLGLFRFRGDDVFKKIGVLSGGEKARVSLAKILLSSSNFLVMDEPTTHLDLMSLEALEQALGRYDGTMLLISHDRYFLDKLVNRVWELKDGRIVEYLGNYSDYLEKKEKESAGLNKEEKAEREKKKLPKGRRSKEQKRIEAQARQAVSGERKRLSREAEHWENEIDRLESEIRDIESNLASPGTYKNSNKVVDLQKNHARLKKNLEEAYKEWERSRLDLEELLESIEDTKNI
ncbi:MAG: ABC-F family ATP-binding cassette domain-containing protein [Candidatus Aminicenantes bacterium]|nr:ABC-F family ATP-binding cassette domain-containing protein [Candidatus Aminicenantes bacterium]